MNRYIVIACLFLLPLSRVFGQVNFIFVPEVYGRSIDGLGVFQVQNIANQPKVGQVYIQVRENISKSSIVTIVSPQFTLSPGSNAFPVNVFTGSHFTFGNNPMAAIVSQTRNFPPGEYTYCYRFVPADKTDDSENCFDANIQPLVPISLISPAEGDKICQKRPPLSWQPPVPFPPSMRFRLLLTEKKKGAAIENLLMNAPLIFLDNIPSTTVSYPSFAADLKEGSTYVWQVLAYQNGIVLSKSEIWEFTVQCNEPVKPSPYDNYRELKDLVNGNYYIANRFLKFSFQNNYNIKKLTYEIYELENGAVKVKHLPDVPIATGLNKIDIDLTDLNLQEGRHYILKVYPFNEQTVQVRFVYHENEAGNE
ncbi:MAG TPA: hypothetical protein VI233_17320 [Puia sp.]